MRSEICSLPNLYTNLPSIVGPFRNRRKRDSRPGAEYCPRLPTRYCREYVAPYQLAKRGTWGISRASKLLPAKTHLDNDPTDPGAPQYRISTSQPDRYKEGLTEMEGSGHANHSPIQMLTRPFLQLTHRLHGNPGSTAHQLGPSPSSRCPAGIP